VPAVRKRKQKLGNCYESAFSFFMERHLHGEADRFRLVHAEICGQGPMEGVRYGHAWILDVERDVVIDKSNGNDLEWPRAMYESVARVALAGDNKHEYDWLEARERILAFEHYGPWDLVSSSGL